MRLRSFLITFAWIGFCALPIYSQEAATKPKSSQAKAVDGSKANAAPQLLPTTTAFLATLSDAQRMQATFEYDSEQRVKWHFIPKKTRKGLPLMEMESAQKEAAMSVLRAALSKVGYEKATTIMQLETVLNQLEDGKGANERNPEKYYFTVFGKPAANAHWGLSIEGHHLSLNFVLQGNRIVDSTPQFFATNPAQLMDSYGENFPKGLKVLGPEEQLAFALVKSLASQQLEKAMLPGETPDEIRGAGEPQPPTAELGGIAAADLDSEQKAALKKLLEAYTNKMKPNVAKSRWKLIDTAGFDKITFGWSGAKKSGAGHYYIVRGPSFVVEFINVQPDAAGNPANHVHCVWRDMQGDFDLPIQN
jgi:hypothetical protein